MLPTAIPQRTRVELAPRQDDLARVASADMGAAGEVVEFRLGAEQPRHGWLDYVQGVTRFLRRGRPPAARVRAAGHLDGADRERALLERGARGQR